MASVLESPRKGGAVVTPALEQQLTALLQPCFGEHPRAGGSAGEWADLLKLVDNFTGQL